MRPQLKELDIDEIYNMLRGTFHSQSGAFLNKSNAMKIATQIKESLKPKRNEK